MIDNVVLNFQRASDHGVHYEAHTARSDGTDLAFSLESTLDELGAADAVFVNGFAATAESMMRPACVAVRKGCGAVAMAATHDHAEHPLDHYVADVVTVANRIHARHLVGLSMGGAAVIRAGAQCESVESVLAISPACVAQNQVLQFLKTYRHAPHEFANICRSLRKSPGYMVGLAAPMLSAVAHRPQVLFGEALELMTASVRDDIKTLQASGTRLRVGVCENDALISSTDLAKTLEKLGIEVVYFDNMTHTQMTTDVAAATRIVDVMLDQAA